MAPLSLGLDLMGRKGIPPIFWAPFNDPSDPLKVYAGGPLTMVRATEGTFLNPKTKLVEIAANNILRIEANGALIEGQRTNLLIRSTLEGGDPPTGWTRPGGTGTSTSVASDFGNEDGAVAISQSATNQRPYLQQASFDISASTTYVFSVRVESVSAGLHLNEFMLAISLPSGASVNYLDKSSSDDVIVGMNYMQVVVDTTPGTVAMRVGLGAGSSVTGTVQFSRPQVEEATFASSYIPTTDAAVSRNQDDLSVSTNPYPNPVGSFVFDLDTALPASGMSDLHYFFDGGANANSAYFHGSNDLRWYAGQVPSPLVENTPTWSVANIQNTIGLVFADGDRRIYVDGTKEASDTLSYTPGIVGPELRIGHLGTSPSSFLFGHIQGFRIFDVALSDTQMAAKTS